jgi:hypothetical protein
MRAAGLKAGAGSPEGGRLLQALASEGMSSPDPDSGLVRRLPLAETSRFKGPRGVSVYSLTLNPALSPDRRERPIRYPLSERRGLRGDLARCIHALMCNMVPEGGSLDIDAGELDSLVWKGLHGYDMEQLAKAGKGALLDLRHMTLRLSAIDAAMLELGALAAWDVSGESGVKYAVARSATPEAMPSAGPPAPAGPMPYAASPAAPSGAAAAATTASAMAAPSAAPAAASAMAAPSFTPVPAPPSDGAGSPSIQPTIRRLRPPARPRRG